MNAFENKASAFLLETGNIAYVYMPQCQVNQCLIFFSLSSLENFDVYNRMPPSNTQITTGAKLVPTELDLC